MILRISYDEGLDDLFVQSEWLDVYGPHSQRITEEMPKEVRDAARVVIDWANGIEPVKRRENEERQAEADFDREIGKLEQRKQVVRNRGRQ
jgi:hypothetical protein